MRIVILALAALVTGVVAAQPPRPAELGPAVGTPAPSFSGVDQFGRSQTLPSLIGPDGLMLVFFRSADW